MDRSILALLAFAALAGCTRSTIDYDDPAPSFQNLPPLIADIRSADSVVIHEGLPHFRWEAQQLENELATKPNVARHNFPFYQETLKPSDADAQALRDLVCADGAFRAFQGFKSCGGFHPDYCVEFQSGGTSIEMLICFGCGEARVYGSRRETYCEFEPATEETLKKLLEPYRKNRPPRKIG